MPELKRSLGQTWRGKPGNIKFNTKGTQCQNADWGERWEYLGYLSDY